MAPVKSAIPHTCTHGQTLPVKGYSGGENLSATAFLAGSEPMVNVDQHTAL